MHPRANNAYLAQTRFIFHCRVKIKIPQPCGVELLDACFGVMEDVNLRYNSYVRGSYFDQINKGAGEWTRVDATTKNLLEELQRIGELSGGAYNVAAAPLLKLWGFYDDSASLPERDKLRQTTAALRAEAIKLRGDKVWLARGQEIITGSFIKAFAVDQAAAFLRKHGVEDAIINAGGSTICALNDAAHPYWRVNIPHPLRPRQVMHELQLANANFSLSGQSESYKLIDGRKYGHILDARSGMPSTNLQVGVLADSAFLSDALSAALFTLTPQRDAVLINKLAQAYSERCAYYLLDETWNEAPIEFLSAGQLAEVNL